MGLRWLRRAIAAHLPHCIYYRKSILDLKPIAIRSTQFIFRNFQTNQAGRNETLTGNVFQRRQKSPLR